MREAAQADPTLPHPMIATEEISEVIFLVLPLHIRGSSAKRSTRARYKSAAQGGFVEVKQKVSRILPDLNTTSVEKITTLPAAAG